MFHIIIRRDHETGSLLRYDKPLTIREVGQVVAWCAADNLGMSREDATREGWAAEKAITVGEGYVLGGRYRFEVAPPA